MTIKIRPSANLDPGWNVAELDGQYVSRLFYIRGTDKYQYIDGQGNWAQCAPEQLIERLERIASEKYELN